MSERVRRWVSTLAVAALVAVGCVAAGLWQWSRHVDRSAAIAVVEANDRGPAVPIDQVVAPGAAVAEQDVWRHVAAVGRYVPGSTVLLRNRPVNGQPGFHVLGGLEITEGDLAGSVLVVDRGWVPSLDAGTASVPAAPSGTVEVVARLRVDERPSSRTAPEGQVQSINAEQVRLAARDAAADWPADRTLTLYGSVLTEDGAPPVGLGPLAPPSVDPGSHLSYAFQWWVFAVGALVGGVMLLRRDEREAAEAEAATGHRGAPTHPSGSPAPAHGATSPAPARRRRRPTAEEEEDALLDAQQGR